METAGNHRLDAMNRNIRELVHDIHDMNDTIRNIRNNCLKAQREVREMTEIYPDLDHTNAAKQKMLVLEACTRAFLDAISISDKAGRDVLEDSSRLELEQLERNYKETIGTCREAIKKYRATQNILDNDERRKQLFLLTRNYEKYCECASKLGLQAPDDLHTLPAEGTTFHAHIYTGPSELELHIRSRQGNIADKPNYRH